MAPNLTIARESHPTRYRWAFPYLRSLLLYFRRNPDMPFLVAAALAFVVVGLMPGLFAPYDHQAINADVALHAPSSEYWLGTDNFGRDILSRLVYGTRVVMLVGVAGIGLSLLVGVTLGLLAGYYGGWINTLIMRVTDALLAFPTLLLAILFVATFGASALNVVIVIVLSNVPRFTRLVAASVLILRDTDFVLASRALGMHDYQILTRHILPNAMGPIMVQATLGIGFAFIIEASMSYLGFGIQPPDPSWGAMLNTAQQYLHQAPWYVLGPGVTIFLAVLIFNLIGDRLREAVDPHLRKL